MLKTLFAASVLPFVWSAPASNCGDQFACLTLSTSLLANGNYKICLGWDEISGCKKSGSISHACPNGDESSKIEGFAAGEEMCNEVPCGGYTRFGLKDGRGCRTGAGSYELVGSGVAEFYCSPAGSSSLGEDALCGGGNKQACTWTVPAPDCPPGEEPGTTTTTAAPTTAAPTTAEPTTAAPTEAGETTTTAAPTTAAPTTAEPTTAAPTTAKPTPSPTPVNCDYTPECPATSDPDVCNEVAGCEPGEGTCLKIWFGLDNCELPEEKCVAACGCSYNSLAGICEEQGSPAHTRSIAADGSALHAIGASEGSVGSASSALKDNLLYITIAIFSLAILICAIGGGVYFYQRQKAYKNMETVGDEINMHM